VTLDRSNLEPHQVTAVELIKRKRYVALWLRMRQGKTVSTLTALQDLYDEIEVFKILIIAPLRVSINSWPEDLEKWSHIRFTHTLVRGTPSQRIALLREPTDVHIINRENVPWLVEQLGGKWPYDTVVVDEARSFKNHTVKTPKKNLTRFGALVSVRPKIRRMIELTGTPAPRNYEDLWAQIYLLDGGRRLGKNITAFRKRYMTKGQQHYQWEFRDGAIDEINAALSDIAFAIEGAPLPEPEYLDVAVEMPDSVRTLYNKMRHDKIIPGLQGYDVTAKNQGAAIGKLAQICAGAVYHTPKPEMDLDAVSDLLDDDVPIEEQKIPRMVLELHRAKLDTLVDIADLGDKPLLVIYQFEFEKDWVLAKFPRAVLLDDKTSTLARWNRGEIPMLVMHGNSGGHGLNLATGGSEVLWLSPTYDLDVYLQVNQRLTSMAKKEHTTVYRLIVPNSVETTMLEALALKNVTQEDLLAYITEKTFGVTRRSRP
jgi:hypothetical protein